MGWKNVQQCPNSVIFILQVLLGDILLNVHVQHMHSQKTTDGLPVFLSIAIEFAAL